MIRANSPSMPTPSVYEPSLCIVVQGRKRAVLGEDVYYYDALNYLTVSVTLPAIGHILEATPEKPYLCLRLELDARMIGELLLQVGRSAMPPSTDRGLYVARTSPQLLDAVLRLTRIVGTAARRGDSRALVLREIHYRVLTGELGHRLRELCVVDSQVNRVARAIELLRKRFTESLRIEDLAAAAHMSESSLHHRFKAVTAMSPMQFQKHLRLHEARRLMLTEGLKPPRPRIAWVMKARRNSAANIAACSAPRRDGNRRQCAAAGCSRPDFSRRRHTPRGGGLRRMAPSPRSPCGAFDEHVIARAVAGRRPRQQKAGAPGRTTAEAAATPAGQEQGSCVRSRKSGLPRRAPRRRPRKPRAMPS